MIVGSLIEVILYVTNMDRAVRFYRDTLGIAVVSPQCDDYSNEYWVVFNTGGCKLCLHGGSTQDRGKDAPKIVFHVDDVYASREMLVSKGIAAQEIISPAEGVLVCNSADPDGNRFSFESAIQR